MKLRWTLMLVVWVGSTQAAQPPDLSGWWSIRLDPPPPLMRMLQKPPVLRPEKQAELRQSLVGLMRGTLTLDYCRPNEVSGFLNGTGFEDALEFLVTPGRITLASHTGLLRRIYLAQQIPRGGPVDSPSGFSTGHWERDGTLVVETTALSATNRYPVPVNGAPSLGPAAKLVERVRLIDSDTLEIRYTLTAPHLADSPLENTATYTRDRDRVGQFEDFCPLDDRLVDRSTGATTFDTRPPEDLAKPK